MGTTNYLRIPEVDKKDWESGDISTTCGNQGTTEVNSFIRRPHPRNKRQPLFSCSPFQGTSPHGTAFSPVPWEHLFMVQAVPAQCVPGTT